MFLFKYSEHEIEMFQEFLNETNVSLNDIQFSPKTRNVIKYNGIERPAELLSVGEDGLKELQFASEQIISDISFAFDDYYEAHNEEINSYFVVNKRKYDETSASQDESCVFKSEESINAEELQNAKELLSTEDGRDCVIDAVEKLNLNFPIESFKLSVRAFNCLKQANNDCISDIIRIYPDDLFRIRNLGVKTAKELCSIVEKFTEEHLEGIRAVMSNSDYSRYIYSEDQEHSTPGDSTYETTLIIEECSNQNMADSLLSNPLTKQRIIQYFRINDTSIDDIELSARAANCLKHEKVSLLSEIIGMYPDKYADIRNSGKKTVDELTLLVRSRVQDKLPDIFVQEIKEGRISNPADHESFRTEYTDEYLEERIMGSFKDKRFKGLSFDEMRAFCPENVDDSRIKHVIGVMLKEEKLEYVDFRCYRKYPSVLVMLETSDLLSEREKGVLLKRIDGCTLEEVGNMLNITRERVRQIENKALKKLEKSLKVKEYSVFDEDYFSYFFSTYNVPKEFWSDYSGIEPRTLGYLTITKEKGGKDISEAPDDDGLSVGLRLRIQDYLDRNKIEIDGKLVRNYRSAVENFIISKYCEETMRFDEFVDVYNQVLSENRVGQDSKLYITEESRRARSSNIAMSRKCLWKYGERLRYYDIDANDYSELMASLGLENYSNTEISTLKLFRDYPDLMIKYDIRDQYELHNLLSKTVNEADYPGLEIRTQPMLRFGEFDRNAALEEIINILSPISQDELIDYLVMEYGYAENTLKATYLQQLKKYLLDGVYDTGCQKIPDNRKKMFLDSLDEDIYPIRSLFGMYRQMFPDSNPNELNKRSLMDMGFTLSSEFALRNYASLDAYYRHLLTKDGVCTIKDKLKRFSATSTFYFTYMDSRRKHEIFLFEPDGIITMERLSKLGVSEASITAFTDSVYNLSDSCDFFSMHSLKNHGFTTEMDCIGFDDFFLSSIIAVDNRFKSTKMFGTMMFCRNNSSDPLTIRDFLLYLLDEYDSIDIDDFIDFLDDGYGVKCSDHDKSKIIGILREDDNRFFYDAISRKIFRTKELYYNSLDD